MQGFSKLVRQYSSINLAASSDNSARENLPSSSKEHHEDRKNIAQSLKNVPVEVPVSELKHHKYFSNYVPSVLEVTKRRCSKQHQRGTNRKITFKYNLRLSSPPIYEDSSDDDEDILHKINKYGEIYFDENKNSGTKKNNIDYNDDIIYHLNVNNDFMQMCKKTIEEWSHKDHRVSIKEGSMRPITKFSPRTVDKHFILSISRGLYKTEYLKPEDDIDFRVIYDSILNDSKIQHFSELFYTNFLHFNSQNFWTLSF